MQGAGSGRVSLPVRRAVAFCPGAITNFFRIHYDESGSPSGATGGGYVLSAGTKSAASSTPGEVSQLTTVVNKDSTYDARTTTRAVRLMTDGLVKSMGRLRLVQSVATPIGSGFGASAASAVSAVYAAASAMDIHEPKDRLAAFAHQAEIVEQTGLGTVSVVYDAIGAGAITEPGEPGVARFRTVKVPNDLRIVTAYLAPYDKKDAISSTRISEKINRLGEDALARFLDDPTLETLARGGERFSANLGLETPEVKKLISTAKSKGAVSASQNMIGYSIHALADADRAGRIETALKQVASEARVDVFRVGNRRAGILSSTRT